MAKVPDKSPHSQTLDRGVRVLEALAAAAGPLTIAELAAAIGVHRSIAYRILRTLEDRRLVARRPDGSCELGAGLLTLARGVSRDLHTSAMPELASVANDLAMTCFVAVRDHDEVVTLASVEPRHAVALVAQPPGTRHPIDRGAAGLAMLAALPAAADERAEVARARRRGYAITRNEVIPGLSGVSAPIATAASGLIGAITVLYVTGDRDVSTIGGRLIQAARTIAADLP